jgi:hypothetical protein
MSTTLGNNLKAYAAECQQRREGRTMEYGPVVLKNNGITCFIPPCFSWDVFLEDIKTKITTVSEIDSSNLNPPPGTAQQLRDQLYKGELRVKGHIERLKPEEPTQKEGTRFVIDEIVGPSNPYR